MAEVFIFVVRVVLLCETARTERIWGLAFAAFASMQHSFFPLVGEVRLPVMCHGDDLTNILKVLAVKSRP